MLPWGSRLTSRNNTCSYDIPSSGHSTDRCRSSPGPYQTGTDCPRRLWQLSHWTVLSPGSTRSCKHQLKVAPPPPPPPQKKKITPFCWYFCIYLFYVFVSDPSKWQSNQQTLVTSKEAIRNSVDSILLIRPQVSSKLSQTGSYEANKPKVCNKKWVLSTVWSFSVRMLLLDIWSRSNFWVTAHTSWVLKSAKRSVVYQGLAYLQTNQSHFCYKCWLQSLDMTLLEWFWRYLWPKATLYMSQEFPTVSFGYYPSVFNRHDCGH